MAFAGDRYGVQLGASFKKIAQWLPRMRPYPAAGQVSESEYRPAVYAVTHVVYSFNDYT